MLEEGKKAPKVKGVDFSKATTILYFYPKDDTPGCTAEACSFRDNYESLTKKGYQVIGVSPDAEEKHDKFKTKYELPFHLVADTDKKIANAYGVWGLKKMYGKEYEGIFRTTFIIDTTGKIIKVIKKVDTKNATQQVLDELA
ncbi:MAG: thioredoxin-dependent thiol peroxidase [Chitinophagales bacterium]|nr:thioredoxin-dependent thiol peroxidase [Chitinophagales bacterium]